MKTTVEFLDAVKEKHGIPSDNQLAIRLGSTRSSISNYRGKKNYLEDEIAMKVADLLEIDPAYVMACVHAERAKRAEEKAIWERIAQRMAVAAVLVLGVVAFSPADHSNLVALAGFTFETAPAMYIMSNYAPLLLVALALAWLAFPRHHRRKK